MSGYCFYIQTFGCKTNQYESQGIREQLFASNFHEVDDVLLADFLLINTCSVTGRAGSSCRNFIRKSLKSKSNLKIILTGCAVDVDEEWLHSFPEVILILGNSYKHLIASKILSYLQQDNMVFESFSPERFALGISDFAKHTRAFVKIQDGCDNYCSYCIIPKARGKPLSRNFADIVAEVKKLISNNYQEIVLTGINIAAYQYEGVDFAGLLAILAEIPGLSRLRLGSLEPPYINLQLLDVIKSYKNICPHFHLPLQSGDDGILKLMGRKYTVAKYKSLVDLITTNLEKPSLTTDVIVGFPGEDATAFNNTVELCKYAGFSKIHVFLFSPRSGTPAASFPKNTPDSIIAQRKNSLIDLGDALAKDYLANCQGLKERIIVESIDPKGFVSGFTDRYVSCKVTSSSCKGTMLPVVITGHSSSKLLGEVIGSSTC